MEAFSWNFYSIKEEPYDYAVLAGESGEKLDESRIRSFAEESGISLNEWHSLDMLLLGREHQYMDASSNEWASEMVVNMSDFNVLSGMNLSVPDVGYVYFQDSGDSMFQTCSEDRGLFYNPCIKEDFTLQACVKTSYWKQKLTRVFKGCIIETDHTSVYTVTDSV